MCRSEMTRCTIAPGLFLVRPDGLWLRTAWSVPYVVFFVLVAALKPADRSRWIAFDSLSPTTSGTRGNGLATISATSDPGFTLLPGLMLCRKTVPGSRPDGCFSTRRTLSPSRLMASQASARFRPTSFGTVASTGLGVGVGTRLGVGAVDLGAVVFGAEVFRGVLDGATLGDVCVFAGWSAVVPPPLVAMVAIITIRTIAPRTAPTILHPVCFFFGGAGGCCKEPCCHCCGGPFGSLGSHGGG